MQPARGESCPSGQRRGPAAPGEDKFLYPGQNPSISLQPQQTGTKPQIPRVDTASKGVEIPTPLTAAQQLLEDRNPRVSSSHAMNATHGDPPRASVTPRLHLRTRGSCRHSSASLWSTPRDSPRDLPQMTTAKQHIAAYLRRPPLKPGTLVPRPTDAGVPSRPTTTLRP